MSTVSPQVWDTNSLVPVCTFGLPDRVFALDMSQVAAVHCLIAVGSAEPQVRLSSSCPLQSCWRVLCKQTMQAPQQPAFRHPRGLLNRQPDGCR